MCGSYSTETEKLYNLSIQLEATKADAEKVAEAISVLSDYGFSVNVVEAK